MEYCHVHGNQLLSKFAQTMVVDVMLSVWRQNAKQQIDCAGAYLSTCER